MEGRRAAGRGRGAFCHTRVPAHGQAEAVKSHGTKERARYEGMAGGGLGKLKTGWWRLLP